MIDDKCPTCPKTGTGIYCDCGQHGNYSGCFPVVILGLIFFAVVVMVANHYL